MKRWIDRWGRIRVTVPLARELPSIALTEEIGGTAYRVTGSYDGLRALTAKLLRRMEQDEDAQ